MSDEIFPDQPTTGEKIAPDEIMAQPVTRAEMMRALGMLHLCLTSHSLVETALINEEEDVVREMIDYSLQLSSKVTQMMYEFTAAWKQEQ